MKAWFEDRGVVLPAVPPAFPALKPAATAQDERILGDGSGNGAVTWWDLWYFWHHLTGGYDDFSLDLDLLDIDRNGKTDWVDLGLLGDYLFGTGSNPHGIGQPLSSSITASLSPDPTGFDFKDDGIWHRFTVNVDPPGSTVQVVVNATSEATLGLEIAQGARAPATSFCPGERDDTRQNFGDGATVWIAGCAEGATNILIADTDHEVLASYEIHVSRDVDASFDIEIVFIGNDITTTHQSFIRRAADRWEAIITEDIPDIAAGFDSNDHAASWWSQWDRVGIGPLRVQESIDDVRIYVGQMKAGLNVYASGGSFWIRTSSNLPILSVVAFHRDVFTDPEHLIVDIATHEIAHALGFGNRWEDLGLLGNPSVDDPDADTYFSGGNAISAFNRAGGWSYSGMKVPVQNGGDDGHWRESVIGGEIMQPTAGSHTLPLSAITIEAMGDMGYRVAAGLADDYTLPPASKTVATARRYGPRCEVPRLPPGGQ